MHLRCFISYKLLEIIQRAWRKHKLTSVEFEISGVNGNRWRHNESIVKATVVPALAIVLGSQTAKYILST